MSDRTIDEVIGTEEKFTPAEAGTFMQDDLNMKEYYTPEPSQNERILELLKTPTGEGDIEDYLNHPLNISKSHGIAQILRGLTGFLGNLKYAVVDVIIGALRFSKEKRSINNYDVPRGSDLPS